MPDTNIKIVTIRPLTNLVGPYWFDNAQVDRPITVPHNTRVQEAIDNGRAELIEMKQSEDGEPVFPDDFRQFFGDDKDVAQWYDGTTDEMVVGDPESGDAYVRYPAGSDSTTPQFDTLAANELDLNGTARTSWPSGAFSDSNGDGTYSLPSVADGISVDSVDTTSMQVDAVAIANELSLPTFGDVANAPATDGVIIYVTGDGATTPEGLYQRQSGSYVHIGGGSGSSFSGDHADLTNVTSAQHHEWPVSPSGLSFDPATQGELDTHTSDTANPHSVTAAQVGALADADGSVAESNLSFDTATQGELDSHDHTGDAIAPDSVSVQNVNNEVYASQFSGAGLASKVENALAWLSNNTGGQGRVRVTPKSDGTAWTWDKDLTLNPFDHESIEIDIDTNVLIEYPGTGWALTFDTGGQFNNDRQNAVLRGGTWLATASSASDELGCIRGIDLGNSVISDMYIDFDVSVSASTYGIRLENKARWSEMNTLAPNYISADYCISFLGSGFNPDSTTNGTNSFHGQYIDGGNYHANQICLDFRGNLQYSQVNAPQCFLFADGCIGMRFDPDGERNWGMTINGGKTEEHASNTTSFRLGPGYDGFYSMPTLVGGFYEHPTNIMSADSNASNTFIPHIFAGKNALEIRSYEPGNIGISSFAYDTLDKYHTLSVGALEQENGSLNLSGITNSNYVMKDLGATGGSQGDVAYHDPSISGDTNTEGPAFYNGSSWISLVDGTTIS